MNKLFITPLICLLSFFSFFRAHSQSYTLNWASSFSPAWSNGATSGTATNIGGSGINSSVSMVMSGGVYATSHSGSGIQTPTVSGSDFVVANSSANLEVSVNYSSPTQYTDITISFSTAVKEVIFEIGDIDKSSPNDLSHLDKVVVTGTDGTTAYLPVLSKYDAVTDPNFLIVSGNTANVNTTDGQGGNSLSTSADQKGTVVVDFGGASITALTIRFENATGAHNNPTVQAIGIGNVTFQKLTALPVTFISFSATAEKQKTVLKWQTASEVNNSHFEIEKNHENNGWTMIGKVAPNNFTTGTREYTYIDPNTNPGINFYRIRQVDIDGSYTYSNIASIQRYTPGILAEVFPNPVGAQSKIVIYSSRKTTVKIELFDGIGRKLHSKNCPIEQGTNEIALKDLSHLQRGHYVLYVADQNSHYLERIKLIK